MGKQGGSADHYPIHVSIHAHEMKLCIGTLCSIVIFHIDNSIERFYCIITKLTIMRAHQNAASLKCEIL